MKFSKLILLIVMSIFSLSVIADVSVRGYQRNNGTYVQPSHRSNPNGNPKDNWSTKGNINPYTGKLGTKNPDYQQKW